MIATEDLTRTSPNGAEAKSGRRHRWVLAGTAVVTALSSALVAAPAGAAGTPPQISVVVSHSGSATVTLGHPKPEATAHISAGDVAYDPTNGDQAVSVVTGAGQAHVYLIAGATEPNEYHIETTATGPTYGALVKGDVYLVAGSGPLSMISDPGASTTLTGGSTSPAAAGNPIAPRSLTFDHSGNLVVAESHSSTSQTASGIQIVAKTACSTSCPYGYSTLAAGDLYTIAAVGAWRGSTRTPALVLGFQVNGWGVAVDAQGNIVDSANGAVLFLNEQSSSVSRYGKTLAAKQATVIAGTATGTGAGTCGDGNKNVPATGGTSANLQFPHPIVDASGNVYVNDNRGAADTGCTWVLPAATGTLDGQTMTAGHLYSLTGAATTTAATNGALANTSGLPNPSGVALDPAGNVVVSLAGAVPALAVIAQSTDTYYDQSMTKGHVYLVSGGASATRTTTPGNATGFKFSGTAAVATEATPPFGITSLVTGAPGDLLLSDGTSATTGTLYLVTKGPTQSAPTVTKVSPAEGPLAGGTTVTVTGSGFTSVTAVKFGTKTGTAISRKSATQLTVVDPSGSAGAVTVSVTAAGGTGTLPAAFTYVAAPTVTKVAPTSGPLDGGTTVTVTGTNFTTVTAVKFGTKTGTSISRKSATQLTVVDPSGSAGAVAVSVAAVGGTGTLPAAFTYVSSPTVTKVTPSKGPLAGGTTVTVTGSGFTTVTAVTFGTKTGTSISRKSATQLTVVDPSGSAGAVAVAVTAASGTGTLPAGFTYVAAPTVTKVAPTNGPAAGGTTVTVTGTNFTTVTAVTFGTKTGTAISRKSATQLTVTDPSGSAGAVAVSVTAAGGTGTLPAAFTYVAAPTVTVVAPTSGPTAGGTAVTVTGTNFTTVTAVKFGTKTGTAISRKSATQLTVVDPSGSAGAVAVSVTAAGGTGTLPAAFTYVAPPTVTKVTPSKGPLAGGTTVTVTGTGFTTVTAVTFGTKTGTSISRKSATQLTVVDPSGSAGAVTVAVTAATGTGTLPAGFTYVAAPMVTKVTPSKGPLAGGTTVTVTGTSFTTVTAVTFGTKTGTAISRKSATQLTVTDPSGSAGAVAVSVTAAGGTGTLPAAFTYVAAPTVTVVAPTSGPTAGGTTVTVTGTNFTTVTAVEFGTKTGTAISRKSATQLTVVDPSGSAGAVAVSVTAAGGTGTLPAAFTYVAPPTVTKVTPSKGPLAGGTTVTVTGTGFTTVTAVTFGTKTGTSISRKSATQLTVVDPSGSAGAVTVAVTAATGTGTLPAGFTYVAAPMVTKVTPSKGPLAGGTTVTVTGTSFTTVTAVTFGTKTGTAISRKSATQLTVVDPAGSAGAVTVSVTTAFGSGTLPAAFTYVAAPTVTKVAPTSGPTGGGTTVTVTGTNFTTVTAVTFGTKTGTAISRKSATQLTVVDPSGSAGAVTVSVTAAGGSATLVSAFTYVAPPVPPTPTATGYWEVASDGGLFAFGTAHFYGSMGGQHLNAPIVGMTATPTGKGYWEVASDGGLFAFGNAQFYGSMGGQPLNAPVVGMTATPTGGGYWEVASDGGLFAFGNAQFYGSMGGQHLNAPIVGMTATPTGKGYWEVASDGGLFAFGNAQFYGSMGGQPLNAPVVGMTATPTGGGYWEVASDGGLFAFGAAHFHGSMGGQHLNAPIVGMTATPTGKGYWEVASDGGLFAFGAAPFFGSMGGQPLNAPVVGMVADSSP